jgi:predicted DNA-binding transcriptional regulator AlpA
MAEHGDRLVRKAEARKALDVGPATLDRLIQRRILPVVRLSPRTVRIRESAIADLIKRCEQPRDEDA